MRSFCTWPTNSKQSVENVSNAAYFYTGKNTLNKCVYYRKNQSNVKIVSLLQGVKTKQHAFIVVFFLRTVKLLIRLGENMREGTRDVCA